ncbi:MAG TPA: hypothetical protein PLY03_11350, partial [Tenuifilaceae bacterium]|nr:hypothetical protein [Tenuifilaceae bacterium]
RDSIFIRVCAYALSWVFHKLIFRFFASLPRSAYTPASVAIIFLGFSKRHSLLIINRQQYNRRRTGLN